MKQSATTTRVAQNKHYVKYLVEARRHYAILRGITGYAVIHLATGTVVAHSLNLVERARVILNERERHYRKKKSANIERSPPSLKDYP